MSAPATTHLRIARDPRGFVEFAALSNELDKLSHPACPDVDWAQVERLCVILFQQNGADLQTAAAFTLARGHLCGLAGVLEGVALLQALIAHWSQLWPPMAAVRLDVLKALFTQLPALLRGLEMRGENVSSLVHLDAELQRLQALLIGHAQQPVAGLQRLREQIAQILQRVERSLPVGGVLTLAVAQHEPAWIRPVVILPGAGSWGGHGGARRGWFSGAPPLAKGFFLRWFLGVSLGVLVAVSVMVGTGYGGLTERMASVISAQPVVHEPVRLGSLSLFEAGSSVLKPGTAKVLINALVGIKAKPDWLIVIVGHTDASGDPQRNQQLSLDRAAAVRDWMQGMGDIPASCFAIRGMAAGQPVAGNDSEAGRVANRRVDIQIVPQVGVCNADPA